MTLPSPIRVHGPAPCVVVAVLMAALLSLACPAGALGAARGPGSGRGVAARAPARRSCAAFDPPDYAVRRRTSRASTSPGAVGQPVHAALAGRVTFAGAAGGPRGRGRRPRRHPYDLRTGRRGRAGRADARAAGSRLGTLELAGSHCFPRACLHWGWRRGETYLDPLLLVGGGPIRLLPLWRDRPVGPSAPATPALPFARVVARLLGLQGGDHPVRARSPSPPPRLSTASARSRSMRPLLL